MSSPVIKNDLDPLETAEWIEAFNDVTVLDGRERAHFLLEKMTEADQLVYGDYHTVVTTPYVNSIPVDKQPR